MRIRDIFEQDEKKVLKLSGGMMTVPMDGVSDEDEQEDEAKPLVIKLGSKRTTTAAQRFMSDFEGVTQEHPFTRGMRYFEDGPVLMHMSASDDFDDEVELRDIQSKARGAGARALKTICDIADERDVSIDLYAQGYAHVPTLKLVEYYQRFGFEPRNEFDRESVLKYPKDHGVGMIRYPR
jgi:hypothetical protein